MYYVCMYIKVYNSVLCMYVYKGIQFSAMYVGMYVYKGIHFSAMYVGMYVYKGIQFSAMAQTNMNHQPVNSLLHRLFVLEE